VALVPDGSVERFVVGFARVLRGVGLRVPASSTLSFLEALGAVGMAERPAVYWAGRATLVHRPEDLPLYDAAFAAWWEGRRGGGPGLQPTPAEVTLALDHEDGAPDGDDIGEGGGEVQAVRFSRVEVLTEKDFADCNRAELDELTRLMARLRFTADRRRSRRLVPVRGRGTHPDLRRTVRWALRHQGEPLRLAQRLPARRPRRLVLLLDVSGSMEAYARALIRFQHAAVVARGRVEAFTLGTRLTRLTRLLANRDPDAALRAATPAVADWSGGTRLGETLRRFNDQWGVRGLARGAVVVILSDGWDRGEPEVLGAEMARLHRVTHRLVWVNPLKASPGYAPLAAGMAAALPHVDHFVEGHAFSSLEHLAALVAGASSPG
jgi:uncharacterized protein with von Willebrand factor type A (vWA) domain